MRKNETHRISLLGLLVSNTFYWRRAVLLSLGHPDFPARVNLVLAGIKVVLIILLVPRFGYLASAVLLSGYYIANSIIYVFKIRSLMNKKSAQT
ncbi:polysaccharide biosynthesis C-terminal domain-containing protein [Chloroflexota bacterium]